MSLAALALSSLLTILPLPAALVTLTTNRGLFISVAGIALSTNPNAKQYETGATRWLGKAVWLAAGGYRTS